MVDAYGGLGGDLDKVRGVHAAWVETTRARLEAEAEMEAARRDEDYLRHALDEIKALDPQPGEEADLAGRRTLMMNAEQLIGAMNDAAADLRDGDGALGRLQGALRHLERVADKAEGRLAATIAALTRAQSEATEADALLESTAAGLDVDPKSLEQAEERLFALRAVARKHSTDIDRLAALADAFAAKVKEIDDGGARVAELKAAEKAARKSYEAAAARLSAARKKASGNSSPARIKAFEMFAEGRTIEQVMKAAGRARSTTMQYLAEFIQAKRPESIDGWIDGQTYEAVSKAIDEVGSAYLKPIHEKLGGSSDYNEIRLVVAHLEARQAVGAGEPA
ncbi:MAG: helix-turn-helix domain-containing protein [Proteobacteria bacterium]|nr:helix-turn-helix domain-containing protein [Pseudomonadota bacterium]